MPTDYLNELRDVTNVDRLRDMLTHHSDSEHLDAEAMLKFLKERVKGQDHVLASFVDFLRLEMRQAKRVRPITAFLVGPPATGKSEFVKAVAEHLFGDQDHRFLIDGSTANQTTKTALVGITSSYVGSEGTLTGALIRRRRQVVVFEEIEKGPSDLQDILLNSVEDGRLQDQRSNKWADFSQAIVFITSNSKHEEIGRIHAEIEDPDERATAIQSELAKAGFRPEVLGRFALFFYFHPLSREVVMLIARKYLDAQAKSYDMAIEYIDPRIFVDMADRTAKREDAARGVRRIVERDYRPILADAKDQGLSAVRLDVDGDGKPVVRAARPAQSKPR